MRLCLRNFYSSMLNSRYVLEGLGVANCRQTSGDMLLCTIAGSDCCTQEGLTNSRQKAADLSKICHLTAEYKRMPERVDALDAHCHHSRNSSYCIQVALHSDEWNLSAFAVENYCVTNERHPLPSDTNFEEGTKGRISLIILASFFSKGVDLIKVANRALFLDSLALPVVHIVRSLNLCCFAHRFL